MNQETENILKDMAFYRLERAMQRNLTRNTVKKIMDTATKTKIDTSKTISKTVTQKKAEAAYNLIGTRISKKITQVGKSKKFSSEPQQNNGVPETNKPTEIYIPLERRQQIIDDFKIDLRMYNIVIPKHYEPVGHCARYYA